MAPSDADRWRVAAFSSSCLGSNRRCGREPVDYGKGFVDTGLPGHRASASALARWIKLDSPSPTGRRCRLHNGVGDAFVFHGATMQQCRNGCRPKADARSIKPTPTLPPSPLYCSGGSAGVGRFCPRGRPESVEVPQERRSICTSVETPGAETRPCQERCPSDCSAESCNARIVRPAALGRSVTQTRHGWPCHGPSAGLRLSSSRNARTASLRTACRSARSVPILSSVCEPLA